MTGSLIDRVELFPVRLPYARAMNWASTRESGADFMILRLTTSDGLIGVSEGVVKTAWTGATLRSLAVGFEEIFTRMLIGLDPEDVAGAKKISRIRENNLAKAMIDIALWDVLGKALGQPVARLLGGVYRTRVMPYCSVLMEEPGLMRDVAAKAREDGYRALKIGWGPFGRRNDTNLDEAIVRAAREGFGEDTRLFVDAGGSDAYWPQGLKWAIRTSHMLKDYNVGWFEEALKPDALEDFVELRKQSPVPIAGGEVLTRRQSFTPWFVRGAFDIVQPDATKVGGISEQRRIAWMAEEFGVRYIGHGWNTAIGVAADLQISAAMPHTDVVEFIGGSAYVDGLLTEPFRLDAEGYLEIPMLPGIGVSLDPEKVSRYAPKWKSIFAA